MDEDYKISEKLSEMGTEKVNIVEDCFNIRKSDILSKLQTEILSKLDNPLVTNFDWKVNWIIGSSSLSSIREPIIPVDFSTLHSKNNENIRNIINFEMNSNELDCFTNQLENAISKLKED